ncbi:hypothetical protein ACFXTN_036556 [Malus domestica]
MAPYQALKIHASNAVVWDYRTGRLVAPPRPPPPPPPRDLVRYVMPNGEEAIASLVNGNINGHDHLLHQETIDTCYALRRRARKTKGRRRISVYYDRFSAGHEWLLDGFNRERPPDRATKCQKKYHNEDLTMMKEMPEMDVNVTSLRVVAVETRRITVISPWVPLQGKIWRHYFCLAMVKDICRPN